MTEFGEDFIYIHDILRLKWVPEILSAIHNGASTFSKILIDIPFISQTELNRKIKFLVERKLITRSPSGVYSLNPFGKEVLYILLYIQRLNAKYGVTVKP